METWRKYHSYQVSDLGRIKNKHGKIMKLNYDMRGYDKINLYINKKRYSYKIHKLVMMVFVGERPFDNNRKEYYQIDHINRNKKDNRLVNLRYCTRDENMKNIKIKTKCKRNMNSTDCSTEDQKGVCIDYIISLASISSLFIISEILPFLKGQNGNGLVDILIKIFEGSDCLLTKLIQLLKPKEEQEEQPVGNENHNLMKTESESNNTNTININVVK